MRACFVLALFWGVFLNIFQGSKLLDPSPTPSRRNSIERANFPSKLRFIKPKPNRKTDLVKLGDYAYSAGWDSSPIVIESHKLVFFTVPKAG